MNMDLIFLSAIGVSCTFRDKLFNINYFCVPCTFAAEMFATKESNPPKVGGTKGSGIAVVQRLSSLHLNHR